MLAFEIETLIKEALLTCCDTETGEEIVGDGPNGSLELQRHPERLDAPIQRDSNDEEDVQPVDMLVPVVAIDSRIGDMDLLSIRSASPGVRRLCRHGGRS